MDDSISKAQAPGPFRYVAPLTAVSIPVFLSGIEQSLVATALPAISLIPAGSNLGVWVIVSYLIGITISAPVYGTLGDAYGLPKMLSISVGIYGLMSILCSQASAIEQLIVFRFLQGLGGGGLV